MLFRSNSMSVNNPRRSASLRLMDFDDRDIKNLVGPNGRPLYRMTRIQATGPERDRPGMYNNLVNNSWSSYGSVNVVTVDAVMLARAEWLSRNSSAADRVMTAAEDAAPSIARRVNPPH